MLKTKKPKVHIGTLGISALTITICSKIVRPFLDVPNLITY